MFKTHDFNVPAAGEPAVIRLYCLPCAGGSAELYRDWNGLLPEWIKVCPIELPGRGRRFGEPLCNDAKTLAAKLIASTLTGIPDPFILFGHSMGALLAYEMAQQLQAAGTRQPALLILSSREPPHCRSRVDPSRSQWPVSDFLKQVRRYGGLSQALEDSPELLELFLPVLRNDFALLDRYCFEASAPLASPLFVVGGDEEPDFRLEQLQEWKRYSHCWIGARCFKGGHFYLNEPAARQNLLGSIHQVVNTHCLHHLAW
ncbi:thioesterase II family protein [Verminephrobacter aporrectodeae]|uniref:thioesterase II family protein n=1 Tax=Verminephrobacter aporrectodeae TaxID=1110389 RepID=UPI0002376BE3|nr:alpha/beta fold hydrolase [Verminephrobacter aporrectodeae]MCW8177630.1 thioesterase [Verminephrobacter aporrectodeae subsp. tuberculatae]MCW8205065.1 thioesterase [Verminephrobacter aporrectodeae subsp. tuberculatae]